MTPNKRQSRQRSKIYHLDCHPTRQIFLAQLKLLGLIVSPVLRIGRLGAKAQGPAGHCLSTRKLAGRPGPMYKKAGWPQCREAG